MQESDVVPFYYFEDMCKSLTLRRGKQDLVTQYYVPYLSGLQLYVDPSKLLSNLRKPGEENLLLNTCSSSSPGRLVLEYLEREKPWFCKPLSEQLEELMSQFDLKQCRSCDLLPASWISVAWYPIYRIPVGLMLGDLDASFLTFHSIAMQAVNSSKDCSIVDSSSKISLPVLDLASFKLRDSVLSPREPHECEQEGFALASC